tara:strand:+ start:1242 stop:1421 length:180 start_codon:yes stop_codon:yes gene_type:complete
MKSQPGLIKAVGGLLVLMVFLLVPVTILAPFGRPWSSLVIYLFFFITIAAIFWFKQNKA